MGGSGNLVGCWAWGGKGFDILDLDFVNWTKEKMSIFVIEVYKDQYWKTELWRIRTAIFPKCNQRGFLVIY